MSRLEWILGILLVLLLIVAVGLGLSLWLRPSGQQITGPNANPDLAPYVDDVAPTPATAGQTAKSAFIMAQQVAQGWQPDARLVSATATWPQGAQPAQMQNGRADWGFTFHSPSQATGAVVTVSNNEVQLIPGQKQQTLSLLDATSWQMDSGYVMEKFLNDGGVTFIEREGITILTMTLVTNDPHGNGRLEWLISAQATQSGNALLMRLDAASGEVLSLVDAS
jgi:hypothetical protein